MMTVRDQLIMSPAARNVTARRWAPARWPAGTVAHTMRAAAMVATAALTATTALACDSLSVLPTATAPGMGGMYGKNADRHRTEVRSARRLRLRGGWVGGWGGEGEGGEEEHQEQEEMQARRRGQRKRENERLHPPLPLALAW